MIENIKTEDKQRLSALGDRFFAEYKRLARIPDSLFDILHHPYAYATIPDITIARRHESKRIVLVLLQFRL